MTLRWCGAALLALILGASAQSAGGADRGGLPLPDGRSTRDLVAPGNGGVAGTGLGGSIEGNDGEGRRAPEAPGTGMSVKGPSGQGIDGRESPDGPGR